MSKLLIEISSASVGVSLGKGIVRQEVSSFENRDPETMILLALKRALETLMKKEPQTADEALVTLSSPWFVSEIRTHVVKEKRDFTFNSKIVGNLLKLEKERFKKSLAEKYHMESEIFEWQITSLKLNGYDSNPEKVYRAKSLEISFLLSATSQSFLKNIKTEIDTVFNVKKGIVVQSFMNISFKVLSKAFQNLHSALLVHMSHEMTDVLSVYNKKIKLNASLPFGHNKLTRRFGDSSLHLFSKGLLSEDSTSTVNMTMEGVEDEWQRAWQKIAKEELAHKDIFLITPAAFAPMSKTLLASILPRAHVIHLPEDPLEILASFSQSLLQ